MSDPEVQLILHLGSNLGNRPEMLHAAEKELSSIFGVPVHRSPVYETRAWGNQLQNDFLNMALEFRTTVPPLKVLQEVKEIETRLGRKPRGHWEEREIDIDIIFYGDLAITSPELTVPHPLLHVRKFVLEPLNAIIPGYIHPVLGMDVKTLLSICPDRGSVVLWDPQK